MQLVEDIGNMEVHVELYGICRMIPTICKMYVNTVFKHLFMIAIGVSWYWGYLGKPPRGERFPNPIDDRIYVHETPNNIRQY